MGRAVLPTAIVVEANLPMLSRSSDGMCLSVTRKYGIVSQVRLDDRLARTNTLSFSDPLGIERTGPTESSPNA
jgi:hypothetical protein